jgi:hypothetical protein
MTPTIKDRATKIAAIAEELVAMAAEAGKELPLPAEQLSILEEDEGIAFNLETGEFFTINDEFLNQRPTLTSLGEAVYKEIAR